MVHIHCYYFSTLKLLFLVCDRMEKTFCLPQCKFSSCRVHFDKGCVQCVPIISVSYADIKKAKLFMFKKVKMFFLCSIGSKAA